MTDAILKRKRQTPDQFHRAMRAVAITRLLTWVAIAATVSIGAIWFVHATERVATAEFEAVVTFATVDSGTGDGRPRLDMQAALTTGQLVRIEGPPVQAPRRGDRILVQEVRGWLGSRAYIWNGHSKPLN